jgi:hypothetical protein
VHIDSGYSVSVHGHPFGRGHAEKQRTQGHALLLAPGREGVRAIIGSDAHSGSGRRAIPENSPSSRPRQPVSDSILPQIYAPEPPSAFMRIGDPGDTPRAGLGSEGQAEPPVDQLNYVTISPQLLLCSLKP